MPLLKLGKFSISHLLLGLILFLSTGWCVCQLIPTTPQEKPIVVKTTLPPPAKAAPITIPSPSAAPVTPQTPDALAQLNQFEPHADLADLKCETLNVLFRTCERHEPEEADRFLRQLTTLSEGSWQIIDKYLVSYRNRILIQQRYTLPIWTLPQRYLLTDIEQLPVEEYRLYETITRGDAVRFGKRVTLRKSFVGYPIKDISIIPIYRDNKDPTD